MSPRHVVVCEKQSFLTASLERECANSGDVIFRWTAYINDFFQYVEAHHCDLAIIDTEQLDAESISRFADISQKLSVLAIAPSEDHEFADLLRELGVTSVLPYGTPADRISKVITKMISSGE
jgi:hypothetical protein